MEALEMTLLFDYYGDLLTERQRPVWICATIKTCLSVKSPRSLGSAAKACMITSAEPRLCCEIWKKKRDACSGQWKPAKQAREILDAANKLITCQDKAVSVLAAQIVEAAQRLEE